MKHDRRLRAYMEAMLRLLSGDGDEPKALRNECHRLLVAIDRDDRVSIEASVERLMDLAGQRTPAGARDGDVPAAADDRGRAPHGFGNRE